MQYFKCTPLPQLAGLNLGAKARLLAAVDYVHPACKEYLYNILDVCRRFGRPVCGQPVTVRAQPHLRVGTHHLSGLASWRHWGW